MKKAPDTKGRTPGRRRTKSDDTRHAAIARIAQGLWEAEGRPEGRAAEHWRLAEERLAAGAGEAGTGEAAAAPRPVQPGFADAAPGMVPDMAPDPAPEVEGDAGGRFARQLDDAPETAPGEAAASAAKRSRAASGTPRARVRRETND